MPSGQGSITAGELERVLLFVGVDNILSPDEWLRKLKNNSLSSQDLCLTFDDGLKSQYDIGLPVLEKYGLKAFWFVFTSVFEGGVAKYEVYNRFAAQYFSGMDDFYRDFFTRCGESIMGQLTKERFLHYARTTQAMCPFYSMGDLKYRFIRNELLSQGEFEDVMDGMIEEEGLTIEAIAKNLWLSDTELKALSLKGHTIGLHSYDHPFQIARLPVREQARQYERNDQHIKKVCGQEVLSMSHPLNSYSEDTLKILKSMGVVCGFRSNIMPPPGKKVNPDPLEWAREDAANILKVLGS